jgi:hypothetical protein
VKDQTTVIGKSILALQKSDPELFTDVVVKGTAIQTIDFHLFLGVFGFWFLQITNLFSTIVLQKQS